jgi:ubiquinol-cytochrome c reductase subunit 6
MSTIEAENQCAIKNELKEKCRPSCVKYTTAYDACVKRIAGNTGDATCEPQFFELVQCLDHCV